MPNIIEFVIVINVVIWKCGSQTIYLCNSQEKDSYCKLQCKTKDFLQPVTFSHPPNHDVGSCIPPYRCHSNYDRYNLTQKKIGNENITYFHIYPLSREKDEGEWICSYGNKASAVKNLTVHNVPEKPKNLTAFVKSPNTVVLTWKKSDNGGSKQIFVIQYTEVMTNLTYNISREENDHVNLHNITLTGLKPDTEYTVLIFANNKNGNSPQTAPVSFTTSPLEKKPDPLPVIICIIITSVIVIAIGIVIIVILIKNGILQKRHVYRLISLRSNRNIDTQSSILSYSSIMNTENTKALIKRIAKSDFIQTGSYTKGISLLETGGVLIYKGVYGDGRFTNAINILKHFEQEGYFPAVIHDITKWDDIVNVNVKMVLLVPDILSKLIIDKKLYESVYPFLERMMGCVQQGKTKIIITCQSEIMNDLWYILRDYEIFRRNYHIDLFDPNYKLTSGEKEQILKVHCNRNGIDICTDEEEENYENAKIMNENTQIKISQKTITEISKTENKIGYPQHCELFCKHRPYTALGKNFFLRPTKFVLDDIDNLKNNEDEDKKLQFQLLKQMWLSYPNPPKLQQKQKNCNVLEGLKDIYVEMRDGQYVLKHETIYIAIGLSMIKDVPKIVIKESNWNFFRYHIKPLKSKTVGDDRDDEATYYIQDSFYDDITERCLADLRPDTMYRYFRYFIECWPGNAKRILNAIKVKEKYKTNKQKLLEIIQQSCQIPDESGIFVQACMYGNISAIEELMDNFFIPKDVLQHCKKISETKLDILSVLDRSPLKDNQ